MGEGLPYLSIRPALSGGFETLLPLAERLPDMKTIYEGKKMLISKPTREEEHQAR